MLYMQEQTKTYLEDKRNLQILDASPFSIDINMSCNFDFNWHLYSQFWAFTSKHLNKFV